MVTPLAMAAKANVMGGGAEARASGWDYGAVVSPRSNIASRVSYANRASHVPSALFMGVYIAPMSQRLSIGDRMLARLAPIGS